MATSVSSEISSAPIVGCVLPPPTSEGRFRFTREAYHRLVQIGVLREDSPVELIDGEIFMMSPIGPLHGALVRRLMEFLVKNVPATIECSIQLPIVSGEYSEPEPDVALLHRREDDYKREHPLPSDVLLVIEVAQSSLQMDLGRKLELYASSGILEYWVIDVDRQLVLIHQNPTGNRYQRVSESRVGDAIAPLAAPDCKLDIEWLFR